MATAHATAISLYEQALSVFAERGGTTYRPDNGFDPELAKHAQELAMPGERASVTDRIPAKSSIVGLLHGGSHTGYYSPQLISSAAAMPETEPPVDLPRRYAEIWQKYLADRARFMPPGQSPAVAERSLHALLQRYTWAMPAPLLTSDKGSSPASLYDYTRVSAALAVCLEQRSTTSDSVCWLLGGDLSGVQDWLYTFGSRGAAKNLRGRSFYLQLLMEIAAHSLLDDLGLPLANLLYVGGGNYYLLLPDNAVTEVPRLRTALSQKLLSMHGGALYVALAAAPLSEATLRGTDGRSIGEAWDEVNRLLNREKARRFAELSDEEMARAIGMPIEGTGFLRDSCAVCRRPIAKTERRRPLDDAGTTECGLCLSFEDLGNRLRGAEFLAIAQLTEPETPGPVFSWQQGLRQLGYDVQLLRHAEDLAAGDEDEAWRDPHGDYTTIYYWRQDPETNHFPGSVDADRTIWSFRPLAQCIPITESRAIATFDELTSDGIPRWGVLRMDVDNLGSIFRGGIPSSSLCRVVGLSGLMRLFFEGHVPRLAESINQERQEPRMYLMYAGGDDLFIVGGWSDLPHLAKSISSEFSKFACDNPQVTISGGISIALDSNYPLYQAARSAGDAEQIAKDRDGKNALAFLGETLGWFTQYDTVDKRVRQLVEWTERGGLLPRSFLMSLRAIDAEWRQWTAQESGPGHRYAHANTELYLGPWHWHMVYSLTRSAERTKDSDLKRRVNELVDSLLSESTEIFAIGLSARWAELLTRHTEDT